MDHEYCKKINNQITKMNLEEWRNDPKAFDAWVPRLIEEFKVLQPLMKKDDYILDIGCRNGAFLEILRDNGYTRLFGADLSPDAVDETLSRGIDCIQYDIQEPEYDFFEPECFDVITLIHVLEHVSDPVKTAANVHKLLKFGGILCVEVPVHGIEPPEDWGHFSIFTDGNQVHKLFDENYKMIYFQHQKEPSKKPWYRYIYSKVR